MRTLLLALVLLSFSHAATVEEVVAQTLQNNPTLQTYTLRAEKFTLEAEKNGLWDDPVLGAGINDIQFERPFERDLEPMQTHALTLSQTIPTRGKRSLKSAISEEDRKIERQKQEAYKRLLRSKVLELSYRYIITGKRIGILTKRIANLRRMHKVMTYLYESSKVPRTALLQNRSATEEARLTLQKLHYQKKRTLLEIQKLAFIPVTEISGALTPPKVSLDIDQSVQKHPSVLALRAAVAQNERRIALEEARQTSDLKVGVGYYQRDGRPDYMSVNFSMPLKIRGKEEIARKEWLLEQKILRLKLKNLRHTMRHEAENLLLAYQTAKRNLKRIDQKLLPLSRQQGRLFRLYARTRDNHTLKIYQNRDDYLKLQLLRLDEMQQLFDTYAKISYYKD